MLLFLIFVAVPIIEITLFVQLGGYLGLFPTLAIVILTAIVGTYLLRGQGLQTMRTLQTNLSQGGDPVQPLLHGILILVAGVLLLTPGFFTDAVGLSLLVPTVRGLVLHRASTWIAANAVQFSSPQGPRRPQTGTTAKGETVDADFEVVDEGTVTPRGTSGWTKGPDT